MNTPVSPPADVLVIFGITGDLATKMTFRSLYRLERRQLLDCPILGVAFDEFSSATLCNHARHTVEDTGETIDEEVLGRRAQRLAMVSGDTSWHELLKATLTELDAATGTQQRCCAGEFGWDRR
jgi:glucose-6-phosphate 1-dehydrogenase